MTTCNRCQTTGFINIEQIPEEVLETLEDVDQILKWVSSNEGHDVAICGCCGDGEGWYGVPGEHYHNDDPVGDRGPYAYNGGLCECH